MQFDGNVSISESESLKTKDALNLPIVATYNVRSLFPKVCNFRTDMLERNISVSFVSEIWQRSDKKEHSLEIEKMLEEDGLKYISTARKANARGISYGGAALIVDLEKYSCLWPSPGRIMCWDHASITLSFKVLPWRLN